MKVEAEKKTMAQLLEYRFGSADEFRHKLENTSWVVLPEPESYYLREAIEYGPRGLVAQIKWRIWRFFHRGQWKEDIKDAVSRYYQDPVIQKRVPFGFDDWTDKHASEADKESDAQTN